MQHRHLETVYVQQKGKHRFFPMLAFFIRYINLLRPAFHHGTHTQAVVEYALAQAQILGRDLKKLVVGEELKALLE